MSISWCGSDCDSRLWCQSRLMRIWKCSTCVMHGPLSTKHLFKPLFQSWFPKGVWARSTQLVHRHQAWWYKHHQSHEFCGHAGVVVIHQVHIWGGPNCGAQIWWNIREPQGVHDGETICLMSVKVTPLLNFSTSHITSFPSGLNANFLIFSDVLCAWIHWFFFQSSKYIIIWSGTTEYALSLKEHLNKYMNGMLLAPPPQKKMT